MKALRAAVLFLTRVPLPGGAEVSAEALSRSPAWFPGVGMALGATVGALGLLPLQPFLASCLVAVASAALTGALHLDGLADCADGLGGGRDRDHALTIMRDSSVGAYGAIALVLALLVFVAALNAIDPACWPMVLAMAFGVGRWAAAMLLRLPYARTDGKASAMLASPRWTAVVASAWLVPALIAPQRALCVAAGAVVAAAWGLWVRRRLGGMTGDVLGAAVVLVELAVLVTAASLPAGPS